MKGVGLMVLPESLRAKLGNEAATDLVGVLGLVAATTHERTIEVVTERFERRLVEEIAALKNFLVETLARNRDEFNAKFNEDKEASNARLAKFIEESNARYTKAKEESDARLAKSIEESNAKYAKAKEESDARFAKAAEESNARFARTKEESDAKFTKAAEESNARFARTKEESDAKFAKAAEESNARFLETREDFHTKIMETNIRITETKAELIKWMFAFWLTGVAATIATSLLK